MQKGFDYIGVSVITMCHDGQGKYLISQRGLGCKDEQGSFEPAGGGSVEPHESLEDAVRREVEEECGGRATDIEFMGFREVFREIGGKQSHWMAFDFKARVDPKDVSIKEPDKCQELRWCTIDEIPQPQHSQFPYFLNKYKNQL
jgi:8-oxo-dGTP pyrophosphatase MutT (NUDIX family)